MSRVYIFLADGFEDIEGLTVVDLMRERELRRLQFLLRKQGRLRLHTGLR